MKLIDSIHAGGSMEQAFQDLDILKLLQLCAPKLTDSAAGEWALANYESDPDELSARYRLFSDLEALPDAVAAAEDAHTKALRLQDEMDKLRRTVDPFHEVLYRYRTLSAFLDLVETLQALSEPADASLRLAALKDMLSEMTASQEYRTIVSIVKEIPSILPFPRHLYVGMNAKEDGSATEIGVIRDDREQDLVGALLGSEAPEGSSASLFPDMRYTRAQYGTHFEEYLTQHFEKHYHSETTKAHKLLQDVDPIKASELLGLTDSLWFLVLGLRMHRLFTNAGYSLCLPDPDGDELEAKGLMYPDLALVLKDLEGKEVTLRQGSSTLITGANHSGKTSYLKTIGQSLVLAQFGFFVPAESFRFKPFQQIYTLFSSGEDSSMSVSRMGVEIQRLSLIMQSATKNDLVLINEPMTSTNPIEAVSICCDLMENFLDKQITHLVVTHLYDIYYLLMTRLTGETKERFESLITISHFDPETGMQHSYRLIRSEPLGNSYALETAKSFRITLEDLLEDPQLRQEASAYCRTSQEKNIYEAAVPDGKEDPDGLSD